MLVHTLQFLRDQVNAFTPAGGPKAELGNIARINDGDEFSPLLQDKVLLSLINIAEDTTIRRVEHFRREDNQIIYRHPPLFLNLTVMFAATHTDYASALLSLDAVLRFFQQQPFISAESSAALRSFNNVNQTQIEKLTFEMVNLSLDQVHQLWSGLGGHHMPSVVYLIRLIELDGAPEQSGSPIREIAIDSWPSWHKQEGTSL